MLRKIVESKLSPTYDDRRRQNISDSDEFKNSEKVGYFKGYTQGYWNGYDNGYAKCDIEITSKINENSLSNLAVLGFNKLPSKNDLSTRYRSLALIYHPDKSIPSNCDKTMMIKINSAYNELSDQLDQL